MNLFILTLPGHLQKAGRARTEFHAEEYYSRIICKKTPGKGKSLKG